MRCNLCAEEATHRVAGLVVCEPCADKVVACPHESGFTRQEYDADGCGYIVWTCEACGYFEID